MFTGIIEEVGTVQRVQRGSRSASLTIMASVVLKDVKVGDSIATNGVCLTVTTFDAHSFTVDVMAETMRASNLELLSSGSRVNLERALRLSDRLGGHIVSGHVDGVGLITKKEKEDNAVWITVKTSRDLLKYMIVKGSITIDGISLTIQKLTEDGFMVSIIPHTNDVTTLLERSVGTKVNLECDVIAKYTERLLSASSSSSGIDEQFLARHGFM
ncbi:MAG: riboflavin synthase [Erysipelotrichaceae bacterium]|nr:riboflavin synthase [Erysipelotrichaceae bacterium]